MNNEAKECMGFNTFKIKVDTSAKHRNLSADAIIKKCQISSDISVEHLLTYSSLSCWMRSGCPAMKILSLQSFHFFRVVRMWGRSSVRPAHEQHTPSHVTPRRTEEHARVPAHLRHQTATTRRSSLCPVSSWTDCWRPPDAGSSSPDLMCEEHPEKLKKKEKTVSFISIVF